jgi:hypothetical protein
MEARRIDHKTYVQANWLLEQYDKAIIQSVRERIELIMDIPYDMYGKLKTHKSIIREIRDLLKDLEAPVGGDAHPISEISD